MKDTMSAPQAAKRAGVTYRQVDHWCSMGLVKVVGGDATPGSGHERRIPTTELPRIRTLGRVSRALRRGAKNVAVPMPLLVAVARHAEAGHVDLVGGVRLSWEVES